VGNYFAKGDTEVFNTIKFKLNSPIKEDESIIKFIQHLERQKTCKWGFGKVIINQDDKNDVQIKTLKEESLSH